MIYRKEEVTASVRTALDMNPHDRQLSIDADVDTLTLDVLIGSKIPSAVRRVHLSAPPALIDGGHSLHGGIHWSELESGWLLLPEDFMRLVVFRMSDWARPVFSLTDSSDARFLLQSSPFKGLRGTADRPICFLVARPEGRALAFYSCRSQDATMAEGTYLPFPRFDAFGGIDICPQLYESVVLASAALTASALGEREKAEVLMSEAQSLLGTSATAD